jgi:hypothetical protein
MTRPAATLICHMCGKMKMKKYEMGRGYPIPSHKGGREGSAENDQANRQFLAVTIQVIPAGAHLSRIQHGEWATEAPRHRGTEALGHTGSPSTVAASGWLERLGNKPMESTRTRATSCQIPMSRHVMSSHVIADCAVVLWPRHTVTPLVLRKEGGRGGQCRS